MLQIKVYRCHFIHFKPFTLLYKTHVVVWSYLSVSAFSWSTHSPAEISIPLIYHWTVLSLLIHLPLKIPSLLRAPLHQPGDKASSRISAGRAGQSLTQGLCPQSLSQCLTRGKNDNTEQCGAALPPLSKPSREHKNQPSLRAVLDHLMLRCELCPSAAKAVTAPSQVLVEVPGSRGQQPNGPKLICPSSSRAEPSSHQPGVTLRRQHRQLLLWPHCCLELG